MNRPTALFGGTFDPVTLGHLDLIRRGARLFGGLRVCVAPGGAGTHFSQEERIALLRPLLRDLEGVEVEAFGGLLAAHAGATGAKVLLRGVRGAADLEVELQMAEANRVLAPGVETVILPPSPETARVSSTLVREVASLGGDVSAWVPPSVAAALRERPPRYVPAVKGREESVE